MPPSTRQACGSRSGLDVIVDDVVVDEAVFGDWLDVLGEVEPTWVGVRCSPDIAVRREQARGDRPMGMTAVQATSVHRHVRYAFEVDTGCLRLTTRCPSSAPGLGSDHLVGQGTNWDDDG